jgi:hypothetical protein
MALLQNPATLVTPVLPSAALKLRSHDYHQR